MMVGIIRAESPSKFAPTCRCGVVGRSLSLHQGQLIAVGNGFGTVEVWELR